MTMTMPWILTALVYAPLIFILYKGRWETIDYTHAYFILPVSLWLVWREKERLLKLISAGKPHDLFLAPLVFGLLTFLFGWRLEYTSVATFSLIPLSYGLAGYLYGTPVLKMLHFPILYLLLMVPPPVGVLDSITLPMRYGISVMTELILKMMNYPIARDGLMLSIGGHDIYMGAPCSGFRSLITMIALGLVYVYVNKGSFKKKSLLLSSVVPLALIGNLLRVVSVCLVTFYLGDAAGHKYHDYSGYFIFIFLIAGLVGLEALLNKWMREA